MSTFVHALRRTVFRRESRALPRRDAAPLTAGGGTVETDAIEIAPNDPLIAYFQSAPEPLELDSLELDSPAVRELRAAGIKLVVPLVSQGELIGLLNLGPRLSDQEYSGDDRRLLDSLATQAAPAFKVAQLVREQEAEAEARLRLEQELEVARLIQQNFLPKELPAVEGWGVSAFYRPARAVGGDFYDFIELPGGELAIVVGDVTDKGVPAAMVMAATRSILRASAQRLVAPGQVLERVNELLCPQIPERMFVTCFYGVLEPVEGRLRFANAGHSLPYVRRPEGVEELRATGMPLGLLPEMRYEEREAMLAPGDAVLFYSDGIVEAHGADREMYGSARTAALVAEGGDGETIVARLLADLERFVGPETEQEDDITIVTLQRFGAPAAREEPSEPGAVLAEFALPSVEGNERLAMERVAQAVERVPLEPARLERLKTAVAEATMNAIEHGNNGRGDLVVSLQVRADEERLCVRIHDEGEAASFESEAPDLEAKLAGRQKPRGWGLFLIERMVDEMKVEHDGRGNTIELVLHLRERSHRE